MRNLALVPESQMVWLQRRPESRDQHTSSLTQSSGRLFVRSPWFYMIDLQSCSEVLHLTLQENSYNSALLWLGSFLISRRIQMFFFLFFLKKKTQQKTNYLDCSFSMMVTVSDCHSLALKPTRQKWVRLHQLLIIIERKPLLHYLFSIFPN